MEPFSPPVRRAARVAAFAALVVAASAPAQAQHRARLSADLAEHLASGGGSVEVIVDGAAAADRLATKYNLKLTRRLQSGGVLLVNAGQLSALLNDTEVDQLSGNIRYKSAALVD